MCCLRNSLPTPPRRPSCPSPCAGPRSYFWSPFKRDEHDFARAGHGPAVIGEGRGLGLELSGLHAQWQILQHELDLVIVQQSIRHRDHVPENHRLAGRSGRACHSGGHHGTGSRHARPAAPTGVRSGPRVRPAWPDPVVLPDFTGLEQPIAVEEVILRAIALIPDPSTGAAPWPARSRIGNAPLRRSAERRPPLALVFTSQLQGPVRQGLSLLVQERPAVGGRRTMVSSTVVSAGRAGRTRSADDGIEE